MTILNRSFSVEPALKEALTESYRFSRMRWRLVKEQHLSKRNTDSAVRAGRLTAWGFMDMTHMVLRAYVSSGVMSREKQKEHCHGAALNRKSEPLY